MPQVVNILDVKSAVDKEWKKARDDAQHGIWKSQEQKKKKRLFWKHKETKKSILRLWWTCYLKNAELAPILHNKGRAVLWGSLRKTTLEPMHFLEWTGLVCVPDDCRKNGCYCKINRLWRRRSQIAQNSWKGMPRRVDVFHHMSCQNNGQRLRIPCYFLNEIYMPIH